jgi:peptidoglycan/LPS O-acetylase OafA/YrhL
MIVAGFMALLNVAVTTAPWQTPIALPTGTTETTVGGVRGEPGFPAPEFLSGSLHPVATMSNRNAGNQILGLLYLGMTVILLLLGFMLPHRNLSTYEQLC